MQWIAWLLPVAFLLGAGGGWALARARSRSDAETSQRRIHSLMFRADRLAGEKIVLLTKLERHGEDLAAIKQQLLARERALYTITGTWPAAPDLPPPGNRRGP
ncbi:MAG: hypothetical protein H0W24_02930 [Lysobacter sp.]|nr:hypothetical protein [Lysobacter sp.]MDQ3268911.1 hypothetical protein [Pseudomonadota bacterium]